MFYTIEAAVFDMFPGFRRGVLVATEIDNLQTLPALGNLLTESAARISSMPSGVERERIGAWNQAYSRFGVDPDTYTPSIRFLHEQIRRGKPPRRINSVVDIMNSISLKWTVPCGGDTLASLEGGDLVLGIAVGNEVFAPLFKPHAVENPVPGEVIYYTPQTRRVMCRRWTWRNADFSKILPETTAVAINVDSLPPFPEADLEEAVNDLATLLKEYCGSSVQSHILSPTNPRLQISL